MSFAPLAVVVVASFIHATWNLLAKRAAPSGSAFVLAYDFFSAVVYAPWGLWLLTHQTTPWTLPAIGCVITSGIVHLGYGLCLQRGYREADLSVVYPVARGTGPLLSSLGAFLLLREAPTAFGILGLIAVVGGIGLISTQGHLLAFREPEGQAGIRWGMAAGALIAAYTVVDAYAVKNLDVDPVIINWGSNSIQFALLLPLFIRPSAATRERMRGFWHLAAMVGVLSPLAYILVLKALRMGAPLSVVAPAREMSMMVGALFGVVILRESVGPWRLVGCLVMIVGVFLLGHG